MATQLNLVTGPTIEPVSLDEIKVQTRVDVPDEDALLADAIQTARERVELETGRQLITATWEVWLDGAPGQSAMHPDGSGSRGFEAAMSARWLESGLWWNHGFIDVPCAPLQSVVSIKYTDTAGALQTWAPDQYQVTNPAGPRAARGRIKPAFGVSWPVTRDQMASIIVRFTAGYGDTAESVPSMLRQAIKWIVGDLFENREDTIVTDRRVTVEPLPYGVARTMEQYRARPITRVT